MGLILSRFRRKKTTTEVLDELETSIKKIEQDGECKEQRRKRLMGYVMVYSVGVYVLFATLYYFTYAGRSQYWLQSMLYASPLLLLPVLVIFLRAGISWYFTWSLGKNRLKLSRMREQKKKILEEVMNTETYKVAKEILEKYGTPDNQSKALKPFVPSINVPGNTPSYKTPQATPGQLLQRQMAVPSPPMPNNLQFVPSGFKAPLVTSLPRPLLDRNRSALDKVVDYLLKDGPSHRMALICKECYSHNGMALAEEFDFVSYKCAYCGKLNPARKQRPVAPLLTPYRSTVVAPRRPIRGAGDDSSVPSSNSNSASDDEKGNIVSKISNGSSTTDRPPSPKPLEEKKED